MSETLPVTADILSPHDLAPADIAAWERLQAEVPEFANPLFGPYFSRAVASIRSDVRVAVYRRNGQAIGFLPFHRRAGGLARPIGAPFSDYQGLVSKKDIGITGAQALSLAGIRSFRANGLVDPHGLFNTDGFDEIEAFVIDLKEPAEDYLEALRAGNPKRCKNYRRLEHRLEREFGPLRLVVGDTSEAAFSVIMAWKSAQFRRTGLQDVLRPAWVSELMRNLFEQRYARMTGELWSLYAGDTLVAAHFGVRQGGVFHPWIASTNPDLNEHSPGQIFLISAIRAMTGARLSRYDLASGHEHYKRPFGPVVQTVKSGLITAGAGKARVLPAAPSAVRKVIRRLVHIAALDPTFAGMARGFAEAAVGITRRGLGNASSSEGVS